MNQLRAVTLIAGLTLSLTAPRAVAQSSEVSSAAPAPTRQEELFEVRLRYGVVYRAGKQVDGLGISQLTYDGLTPNDPGLQGWVWPLVGGVLGFTAGISREGFGLFSKTDGSVVTAVGLLRANAGVSARWRLGPVRLEPVAGYGLHQVADFDGAATDTPRLRAGTRHGLLLGARALLDLGPVTIEGRFEYPISLAAFSGTGLSANSLGLSAGGGVRVALFRVGMAVFGLMLDGTFCADEVRIDQVGASLQQLVRIGASLDVQWKAEDRPATLGTLRVTVLLDETSAPAPGARVTVRTAAGEQQPTIDEAGVARLDAVTAGAVTASATLAGFETADAAGAVTAGAESTLVLRLRKAAPTVGSLRVSVTDKATAAVVANATVVVNGQSVRTDAKGSVTFQSLPVGAVSVELSAPGYASVTEGASILPGLEATVAATLVSNKRREPATLSGFVRSARGGEPITANLEIPEASIKARADAKGAFSFKLSGGTYTITISARGFVTQTKQVTVKDGDQAIFNLDLQPK